MGGALAHLVPLRIGSPVCFEDCWKGKVSSFDVTDQWEILNITVTAGFLFAERSVKLPFSSVTSLPGDGVRFGATSTKAFARQIPPVAAPSRSLSAKTPAAKGFRFAGALLASNGQRRAAEVLLARGFTSYRVPVEQLVFEGPRLMFTSEPGGLTEFHFDADVLEAVRRLIAKDPLVASDEKLHVKVDVDGGVVVLTGNARIEQTRRHLEAAVARVPGVVAVRSDLVDDITLEAAIGLALAREALAGAGVYPRSGLGIVTLYGNAVSTRQAEDIVRAVARVPGVREVRNQLQVRPQAHVTGLRV
jgi:hypothetical protein